MTGSSAARPAWVILLLPILACAVTASGGCSRTKHRLQADCEAYQTIAERNCDPRWNVQDYSIDIDPRSRYFDPFDPDKPPMPADDPTAHEYMRCVDGEKGWKHWHDNGERVDLENPSWRECLQGYVEIGDGGTLRLTLDTALKLANIHSPNRQTQLETLYLSSLDVSAERFRLDTQFFGGYNTNYLHQGSLSPPFITYSSALKRFIITPAVDGVESNLLTVGRPGSANPALQWRRRFATAGDLLVGFANSFVFEFTGGDANLAASLANFSLVQPLLRGAGRDIALEDLTSAERDLLANLRAYSRYQQGFYTQVAIGELGVAGPQALGARTNVAGFTGQFSLGGGYVGLLEQQQQLRNRQDNLSLQLRTLAQLEAHYDGGVIDLIQVDQFRQSVQAEKASLLQNENSLALSLEVYKTSSLGLPPDLPIELDDSMIRQFQLVARKATGVQDTIAALQDRVGELWDDSDELQDESEEPAGDVAEPLDDLAKLDVESAELRLEPAKLRDEIGVAELQQVIEEVRTLIEPVRTQLEATRADVANMERTVPAREATMSEKDKKEFAKERSQLRGSMAELTQQFEAAEARLTALSDDLSKESMDATIRELVIWLGGSSRLAVADGTQIREEWIDPTQQFELSQGDLVALSDELTEQIKEATARGIVVWLGDFYRTTQGSILVQARARLEAVTVERTDLNPYHALDIALENRLDFMNARASLVDSWRQIQVTANALQSSLNITAEGDLRTAKNNPVSFRAPTGKLRLGLEFDAPFTRLLERNDYRQSLINYQRNRRNYIQSRDSLHLGLRTLLRQIELLRTNLEIQRRAVAIAIRRVDSTRAELYAPFPPPQPGSRAVLGPTAAINLLSAQNALRDTQNFFMGVWLNYYAARMRLARELGIMVLDQEGRWIEYPLPSSNLLPSPEAENPDAQELPLPPPVAVEWLELTERVY